MGDWDSPEDLQPGDTIEICHQGLPIPGRWRVVSQCYEIAWCTNAVDPMLRFSLPMVDPTYAWKRVEVETLPTLPVAAEAPPIAYGATCKRCNTFNEYAEAKPGYTCYSCRL